jgi:DNA-binding winged helix-turn-helix (wHTH) protein/Tfp pilus assembly protein PilF
VATLVADRGSGIRLAEEAAFAIGRLRVVPALRQVIWKDGARTLEPRVMQVLVALGREPGAIVGRDSLIERCWGGRIVGENAIQRTVSLLRAMGAESGAFEIETITKVGYRLKPADPAPACQSAPADRRGLLLGASATLAAAATGAWLLRPSTARREAERLRGASVDVLRRDGPASVRQAIDLLERSVRADPDYADGWADLANARLQSLAYLAEPDHEARIAALRRDALRALALDRDNRRATVTLALSRPHFRNWLEIEGELRSALARFPDDAELRQRLGELLLDTGRIAAASEQVRWLYDREPLVPGNILLLARAAWYAGDPARADALLARAQRLASTEPMVWLSRFNFLLLTGRASAALALARESTVGLGGQSPLNQEVGLATAQALSSRRPAETATAVETILAARRIGRVASFIAIPYLIALGAHDHAWKALYVYLIGKRDPVSGERSPLPTTAWRRTDILFSPPLSPLRADQRFGRLTASVGLDRYWQQSGTRPDKA